MSGSLAVCRSSCFSSVPVRFEQDCQLTVGWSRSGRARAQQMLLCVRAPDLLGGYRDDELLNSHRNLTFFLSFLKTTNPEIMLAVSYLAIIGTSK